MFNKTSSTLLCLSSSAPKLCFSASKKKNSASRQQCRSLYPLRRRAGAAVAFGRVLCAFTLLLIGVLAFSIRLFSVRSTRTAQFRSYWEFNQGFARPHAVSPVRWCAPGDQVRERYPRVRSLLQLPRHSGCFPLALPCLFTYGSGSGRNVIVLLNEFWC